MRFSAFSVTDHYVDIPRTIAAFYDELVEEIVLSERLGFDTYFLAEHHFHEYGIVPNPAVLLAAASQRTSRIGLGVAVSLLVFHNPLVTAEEYAMVDQLSKGRLRLGMGSGYLQHEFDGMGIGPWEKRARFDEAVEILRRAWPGEPFSYHGLYHHVQNTRIAVTPVQQPEPENWVAVIRPEAAYYVGRQGRNIMLIPYASADTIDDLQAIVAEYGRGRAEGGFDGPGDVAAALHTYVGADQAGVQAEIGPALQKYVDTRLYSKSHRTYEELDAAGLILFGDPQSVAKRVRRLGEIGVNHLMVLANFGGLEQKAVHASLTRFAGEVIPLAD
jgi:alkanesulfonate monooxygenase SsuD/methylene tetrahydromethanopterin reductase-like flavin-dependent oxidoreductase (luciferase family)